MTLSKFTILLLWQNKKQSALQSINWNRYGNLHWFGVGSNIKWRIA